MIISLLLRVLQRWGGDGMTKEILAGHDQCEEELESNGV